MWQKSFYGLAWQNIDLIGLVSSFLAVIDPSSFDLVVLVIVVGVEIGLKFGTNGTKNVREQNLFLIEQKIAPNWTQSREFEVRKKIIFFMFSWPFGVHEGHSMALKDLLWSYIAFYGLIGPLWSCVLFYGLVWPFYSLVWHF